MVTETRKIITIHGVLHPKNDVDRIYFPWEKGCRRMISCKMCIVVEENSLGWYGKHSSEFLLQSTTEWNALE